MTPTGESFNWRGLPRRVLTRAEVAWSQRLFPAPAPAAGDQGQRFWICLLTLAILAGCLLFPNLSFPLLEPDEGRRAEISREILANDDWVVCTLNQQPYYDKPPLFHWLVALSFCCFGTSEMSARLVPALVTLLTILTTFALGRRLIGHRPAFLGALALTAMGGCSNTGRLVGLDGTLTLFLTASLLAAHEAVQSGQLRWRWWLASAVLCGLGVLTKGPIALVLVMPPVLLHARLSAGACRPTLGQLLTFGAVVAGVAAPWVMLVLLRDPQLLWEFVVEHNIRRFTDGIAHEEAWWYYVPVLAAACLPWSPLFLFFLRQLGCVEAEQKGRRSRPLGFLLLWGSWCVLFFSLSRGKLPLYILPSLPAFALLTGWYLEQVLWPAGVFRPGTFVRSVLPRLTLVLVGTGWTGICFFFWEKKLVGGWSAVLVGFFTVTALTMSLLPRGRWAVWSGWGLCVLVTLGLEIDLGHRLVPALARQKSPLTASAELRQLVRYGPIAVACPGQMWASVTFVCRGAILDSDAATEGEWRAFLDCHRRAVVIVNKPVFECLRRRVATEYRFKMLQTSDTGYVVLAEHESTWKKPGHPDETEISRLTRGGGGTSLASITFAPGKDRRIGDE